MKRHFEVLDGLRGTAALLLVAFHLLGSFFHNYNDNPLRHGYLAVDFFFLLSGFVVGYAYDDRWPALTVRDFLRLRLVRLHPLVVLGIVVAALCYWFDPYVEGLQRGAGLQLVLSMALGALLLPSPPLPNRIALTHSLNSPGWSLLQEYLANLAYALVGRHLGPRALLAVVALAGTALVVLAVHHGHLHSGWRWDNLRMAPVRMAFPFATGLLLYRRGIRIRLPGTYWVLSVLLGAVLTAPAFQPAGPYEAFCVVVVFPFIVAAGAGTYSAGRLGGLCRVAGRLSYPLYLLHFPFVEIFSHWVNATNPSFPRAAAVMGALFGFFLVLAWAALRFYDEPVRAWLGARAQRQLPAPQLRNG